MSVSAPLILLVDDDHDCLEASRHILEAAGYRVSCAYDAAEAQAMMARERPALVVTDLMMQELDTGFGFARRVKEDPRFGAVPVVVLTAVGRQLGYDFRPRSAGDLQAMNIDAFLEKPATPPALLQTVRRLLES